VEGQVRDLWDSLADHSDFVIKPAHGSGGEGILVVAGRVGGKFRRTDGVIITLEEANHHVYTVLSGMYSLGGQPDKALIEYRVHFDPVFDAITYQGVPDIRIIVFLGVPVMSMVRLPTRMSGGKANLHQGALGAGIDLATGMTLSAVWRTEIVYEHPDTGAPIGGVTIPRWEELLELAGKCYEITRLGYLGVDIVLDKDRGPLILEMNARPGLNIQIANKAGLAQRLSLVEQQHTNLRTVSERIEFSRQLSRSYG
jgi:alpha-L-glutamate ligase-like protein